MKRSTVSQSGPVVTGPAIASATLTPRSAQHGPLTVTNAARAVFGRSIRVIPPSIHSAVS
ncbi:hypothetical protein ACWC0A_22415 [Streptomyces scopuliridis]